MRQLGSRLAFGLREAGWKVDENVLWPVSDAIQYMPSEDGYPPDERRSWWRRNGVDLAIAVALAVVAFLLRRHGLPTDGLWFGDAVQAAALPASASDLFAVSADHPGYTALLIGWRAIGGGSDAVLTYPTLAAGALGPGLLYLALRYCGYERSLSVLLGAALAVAATDVVYSGRVKTYTIDVLIVLALALIVPRLTRLSWSWWTGLAWIAASAVLAFWSAFGLIAVAVAGVIIVLHPTFDFRLRVVAVALQEAICVVLLAAENHSHDIGALQDQFRATSDAFIDFDDPIQFAGDAFVHLRRVGAYFVGSTEWFAGLCIVVAIIGLAVAAWAGRQAVRARYLLLLLLVAFIGGVAGAFPFGPSEGPLISSGGRVSLWLIPVVAIGLAAALHGLRGILPDRLPRLFDAVAYFAAAAILVIAFSRDPVEYPFPGADSATQFIQRQLGEGDAVLVGYRSDSSYAVESGLNSGIERTPETSVGFQPTFDDPRVHRVDAFTDPQHVSPEVGQADRVFVYYSQPPFSAAEQQLRTQLASTLGTLGFRAQPTHTFQDATVQIWMRPGTRSPGGSEPPPSVNAQPPAANAPPGGNLAISDLPQGWKFVNPPSPPPGTRLLACMGRAPASGPPHVVAATGPPALNLVSQVTPWASAAAASRAVSTLGRPAGAACARSSTAQAFAAAGVPLRVTVNRVPAPPSAGRHAVAYRVVGRDRLGGPAGAAGTLLFLSRGRTTALVTGLRGDGRKSFPQPLMADLATRLAKRIGASSP